MCSSYNPEDDSQDPGRIEDEHADVRRILKQRQLGGAARPYRFLAASSGSLALVLWGYIFADSAHEPGAPIDRAYGAFLTFSAVVGVAAVMAGIIWLRERDAGRRSAEADRIREYQHARQVRAFRATLDSVLAGPPDGVDGQGLDPEVIELGRRLNQKVTGGQQQGWNRAR